MPKSARRAKKSNKSYIVPLFWAAFAAVIVLFFIINMPRIKENIDKTRLNERLLGLPVSSGTRVETEVLPQNGEAPAAPALNEDDYPSLEEALAQLNERIAAENRERGVTDNTANDAPPENAEGRTQPLYFMRMDNDGTLVRVETSRALKSSQSPLYDAVNALLTGPTPAEKSRGLTTLIPEGTKLINAALRGQTAVLNFSENFMFNNYGAEGYLAQLRQIVWTAESFSSVRNVQFLVEGRRIDFLGDNIRLDVPISRDNL